MFDRDLFGDEAKPDAHGSLLATAWEYPPFSVLNAREGWWQERKRQWLALGIKSELGRGETTSNGGGRRTAAPGGSARPACDYSNKQRGAGNGRAM